MSNRILRQNQFAKIAGINPSRVTVLMRGRLKKAVVGKKINLDHELVIDYLRERQVVMPDEFPITELHNPNVAPAPPLPPPHRSGAESHIGKLKAVGKTQFDLLAVPENIRDLLDKTLLEIFRDFGTDARFFDWVKSCKAIEDVYEKRVKTAKLEGEYIPRALVETHVFSAISDVNNRLLGDSSRTITARAIEAYESGESKESIEIIVRSIISDQLRNMKKRAEGALRSAR